ncbi:hypothetical protein AVEN_2973-1 [Araneus ventricosus]|uniref:Transposase Tc1-like domain-containing protein n=1 Tax=Araneus ventricosus TaxID=182803 RepID=A0A4Y2RRQ0_ARAVE|nr:hypothetical protein AVEN_2973-1 [Araneus ventricosus]
MQNGELKHTIYICGRDCIAECKKATKTSITRNPAVTPQRLKKGLAGPIFQLSRSDSSTESEIAKAERVSRRNHLHYEMRFISVGMLQAGARQSAVAREDSAQRSVIHWLWNHCQRHKNASRRRVSGRRRIATTTDVHYLLQCARCQRTQTARQLASQLSAVAERPISRHTVSRRLLEGGLPARRPVVCATLSPTLVRARLQWAHEHRSWTTEQ